MQPQSPPTSSPPLHHQSCENQQSSGIVSRPSYSLMPHAVTMAKCYGEINAADCQVPAWLLEERDIIVIHEAMHDRGRWLPHGRVRGVRCRACATGWWPKTSMAKNAAAVVHVHNTSYQNEPSSKLTGTGKFTVVNTRFCWSAIKLATHKVLIYFGNKHFSCRGSSHKL